MKLTKKKLAEKLIEAMESGELHKLTVNEAMKDRLVIADPFKAITKIMDTLQKFSNEKALQNNAGSLKGVLHMITHLCMDVIMNEVDARKRMGILGEMKNGVMLDILPGKGIVMAIEFSEDDQPKEKVKLEDMAITTRAN